MRCCIGFVVAIICLMSPSLAFSGTYCGGAAPKIIGRGLNLNGYCRTLYGANATAHPKRADALGWVCRVLNQPDRSIDMNAVCKKDFGSLAIATLRGIHSSNWKCILPSDLAATITPVLLYPKELVKPTEIPFVRTALEKLTTLMAGVQSFYQDKSGRSIEVSVPFVALTDSTAQEWQNLANATQLEVPGYPKDRYAFFYRGVAELKINGWDIITKNSSARIGGFTSLGASFHEPPSGYGAAAQGSYFIEPPNISTATCSADSPNPSLYEGAFYATGHELGHTLSLPHTNNYDVTLPSNWRESMMYNGRGTASKFFSFEVQRLQQFLNTWHLSNRR